LPQGYGRCVDDDDYARLASNYQLDRLAVPVIYKSIFCGHQILLILT